MTSMWAHYVILQIWCPFLKSIHFWLHCFFHEIMTACSLLCLTSFEFKSCQIFSHSNILINVLSLMTIWLIQMNASRVVGWYNARWLVGSYAILSLYVRWSVEVVFLVLNPGIETTSFLFHLRLSSPVI